MSRDEKTKPCDHKRTGYRLGNTYCEDCRAWLCAGRLPESVEPPKPSAPQAPFTVEQTVGMNLSIERYNQLVEIENSTMDWRTRAFAAQKAIYDLTGIELNDQAAILDNYHETRKFHSGIPVPMQDETKKWLVPLCHEQGLTLGDWVREVVKVAIGKAKVDSQTEAPQAPPQAAPTDENYGYGGPFEKYGDYVGVAPQAEAPRGDQFDRVDNPQTLEDWRDRCECLEREMANYRRNAAHRAEQIAKEMLEANSAPSVDIEQEAREIRSRAQTVCDMCDAYLNGSARPDEAWMALLRGNINGLRSVLQAQTKEK